MIIGVLSDTHLKMLNGSGDQKILDFKKVINEKFSNVDLIIHAGDIGSMDVINWLNTIAPTEAIFGNMDNAEARRELPEKKIVEAGTFKIGIIHGYGPPEKLQDYVKMQFVEDDVDCIIFGHSHMTFNKEIDGILFFNPGSPTDQFFAEINSIGILKIDDKIQGEIIYL